MPDKLPPDSKDVQRIVLTGGPGAGKTTTLELLHKQGYETGPDAARSIIRERKHAGLPPRPDAATFAQQVFDREVHTYLSASSSPVFFERGIVEAVAMLSGTGALDAPRAEHLLKAYPYHRVFIFPPWEDIYCMDDERDHPYEHAERVYASTLGFYRRHGYQPIEVPKASATERAHFVLQAYQNVTQTRNNSKGSKMANIEHMQPNGLVDVRGFGFSHVTRASGGSQLFISGQVSVDANGKTVGPGDLVAQTRQVMRNLEIALQAADATFSDVVKLNVYIVDYDPATRADVLAVRREFIDPFNAPASTLVGVSALAAPDYLIEIEATAYLD